MGPISKFKVGDKVRIKKDSDFSSQEKHGVGTISGKGYLGWWTVDFKDGYENSYRDTDIYKVGKDDKPTPVQFILKYMRDEDPFEEFESKKDLNKRIKELLEDRDVREDSMEVFEVKKHFKVKVNKSVRLVKV